VGEIMKTNSNGSTAASDLITGYINALPDWRGPALERIRNIFHEADPEIVEEWKWMGSPVWSRHGIIAVANAHRGKVKLTFKQGAQLPDPHRIFNAGLGGKKWRAIDLFEGDEIDEAALRDLIQAAIRCNTAGGGS
jgi:hypothetical protein